VDWPTRTIVSESSPERLVAIHNAIPGVRPVSRMSDRKTAMSRVLLALERAGMKLARCPENVYRVVPLEAEKRIRVLVDHNPKRGASAVRFALYQTGMTSMEYVEACERAGFKRARASQDMGHDRAKGFIEFYQGTS
jgi:hypothetical protein